MANLSEVRKRQGWTQERLAAALGVTRLSVIKWEQKALPRKPTRIAVATILGVSEAEIWPEDAA